jgi:hypothetical protein
MQRIIAQIHPKLAWLFLAGLFVQVYLAGAPMFGVTSFQPHRMLGGILIMLAILLPVLALVGGLPRQLIVLSMVLGFLAIIQAMLPALRGTASWIAALHSVNALALVGLSIRIGRASRTVALPVS